MGDRPLRILFFTENFPPEVNASATRVYERARYWVDWGHEVTVLTCAPNFPDGQVFEGYRNVWYLAEEMQGIRVVRLKTFVARNEGIVLRTLDFLSYMLVSFAAGLRVRRPDVIISTSPQFFAAVGAWGVAALRRVPYIFELGDLWPESIAAVGAMRRGLVLKALEKVELFLYRRADAIVALTQAFKNNLMERGVPPGKIVVARNGVELATYGPRSRDAGLERQLQLEHKFVVGYLGTHGMAHALDKVLLAADLLRGNEQIRFLFVGSGAAKAALEAQSRSLALPNVAFVDRQKKAHMPAYWSLCDLALVHLKDTPLFATVLPSKIFEAMGMGVPIMLAAPAGEASELVAREGAGVCIAPEDPQRLAEVIADLGADDRRLGAMAERAHQAAKNYTRERQAEQVLQAAQRVVRGEGMRVAEISDS